MSAPSRRARSLAALALTLAFALPVHAQTVREDGVAPMGDWAEFRQAPYRGRPILVHLRTGYERAVLMPEPVRLAEDQEPLPECAIEIDGDIVGFYPRATFERRSVTLVGLETERMFTLWVRASETGLRQPLEIVDR